MKYSWYTNIDDSTSADSIHQVLAFGSLDDIRHLREKVGIKKINELFLQHPKKVYTLSALNFIKNFVLKITTAVDEQKYIKSIPRHIG